MSQGDKPNNVVSGVSLEHITNQTAALFSDTGAWSQLAAAEKAIHRLISKQSNLQPPMGSGAMYDEFVNGLNPVMEMLEGKGGGANLPLGAKFTLFQKCLEGKSQRARVTPLMVETKMQALARCASDVRAWVDTSGEALALEDKTAMLAALDQYDTALPDFEGYALQVRKHNGQGQGPAG